jgi:hypothetical protein
MIESRKIYMEEGRKGIDADNQEISYAKDSLLIECERRNKEREIKGESAAAWWKEREGEGPGSCCPHCSADRRIVYYCHH